MSAGLQTSGDRQRRCEGLNAGFSPAAQMLYEAAAEAPQKLKKFKIATAADDSVRTPLALAALLAGAGSEASAALNFVEGRADAPEVVGKPRDLVGFKH